LRGFYIYKPCNFFNCDELKPNPIYQNNRIKLIADTVISNFRHKIIQVDSSQYLFIPQCGIIKLK